MQIVSPVEIICMKSQILFSEKNKKNIQYVVCWKFDPEC